MNIVSEDSEISNSVMKAFNANSNERYTVIVGGPNSGKSTIFNFLTKNFEKTGNWSGVTVYPSYGKVHSQKRGRKNDASPRMHVIDLPGINDITFACSKKSLIETQDEIESYDVLKKKNIQYIINVVDASRIQKDLYLTLKLIEMGFKILVIINKNDIALKNGFQIDAEGLQKVLGCNIVLANAKKKKDLQKIVQQLNQNPQDIFLKGNEVSRVKLMEAIQYFNFKYDVNAGEPLEIKSNELCVVKKCAAEIQQMQQGLSHRDISLLLDGTVTIEDIIDNNEVEEEKIKQIKVIIDRYNEEALQELGESIDVLVASERHKTVDLLCSYFVLKNKKGGGTCGMSLDDLFLNDWLAIPIFIIILYLMFLFTIVVGGFLQEKIKLWAGAFLFDPLYALISPVIQSYDYLVIFYKSFVNSVEIVISFTPIIWALYLFMSFLEESGYMARAAFTMEKILNKLGLPGKSIIPLVIGFGCNVPSIMLARSVAQGWQRIIITMMIPFMSCSARLTVFALFGSMFFAPYSTYIILILHLSGIIIGLSTSYFFKKIMQLQVASGKTGYGNQDYYVLELPSYQIPNLLLILKIAVGKVRDFLLGVGKNIVIIALCFNIMCMVNFKGEPVKNIRDSVLTSVGKAITPIFYAIGIQEENWEASVSLMTGILAKEVVIGTIGILYGAESLNKDILEDDIVQYYNIDVHNQKEEQKFQEFIMQKFGNDANVVSYLIFILLYFPCVSVYIAIKKELGLKYALIASLWSTSIAYLCAFIFCVLSYYLSVTTMSIYMMFNILLSVGLISLLCFITAKLIFLFKCRQG